MRKSANNNLSGSRVRTERWPPVIGEVGADPSGVRDNLIEGRGVVSCALILACGGRAVHGLPQRTTSKLDGYTGQAAAGVPTFDAFPFVNAPAV